MKKILEVSFYATNQKHAFNGNASGFSNAFFLKKSIIFEFVAE